MVYVVLLKHEFKTSIVGCFLQIFMGIMRYWFKMVLLHVRIVEMGMLEVLYLNSRYWFISVVLHVRIVEMGMLEGLIKREE